MVSCTYLCRLFDPLPCTDLISKLLSHGKKSTCGHFYVLIQAIVEQLSGCPSQQLVAHCSPAGVLDCLASELLWP